VIDIVICPHCGDGANRERETDGENILAEDVNCMCGYSYSYADGYHAEVIPSGKTAGSVALHTKGAYKSNFTAIERT
jgi:rubredoxin